MRRIIETGVFLGIAGFAHVMFFWTAEDESRQSTGAGGEASVSLVAIMATAEAMVETWERPPDAVTTGLNIESPVLKDTTASGPVLDYDFSADAQVKIAALDSLLATNSVSETLPSQVPSHARSRRPTQQLEAPVI